jgi:hypothetical protein
MTHKSQNKRKVEVQKAKAESAKTIQQQMARANTAEQKVAELEDEMKTLKRDTSSHEEAVLLRTKLKEKERLLAEYQEEAKEAYDKAICESEKRQKEMQQQLKEARALLKSMPAPGMDEEMRQLKTKHAESEKVLVALRAELQALTDAEEDGTLDFLNGIAAALNQLMENPTLGVVREALEKVEEDVAQRFDDMSERLYKKAGRHWAKKKLTTVAVESSEVEMIAMIRKEAEEAVAATRSAEMREMLRHDDAIKESISAVAELASVSREHGDKMLQELAEPLSVPLHEGAKHLAKVTSEQLADILRSLAVVTIHSHPTSSTLTNTLQPLCSSVPALADECAGRGPWKQFPSAVAVGEFLTNNASLLYVKGGPNTSLEIARAMHDDLLADPSVLASWTPSTLTPYNSAIVSDMHAKNAKSDPPPRRVPSPSPSPPDADADSEDATVSQVTPSAKLLFEALQSRVGDDAQRAMVQKYLNMAKKEQRDLPPMEQTAACSLIKSALSEALSAFELELLEKPDHTEADRAAIRAASALQTGLYFSWNHLWDFPTTTNTHIEKILSVLAIATH